MPVLKEPALVYILPVSIERDLIKHNMMPRNGWRIILLLKLLLLIPASEIWLLSLPFGFGANNKRIIY